MCVLPTDVFLNIAIYKLFTLAYVGSKYEPCKDFPSHFYKINRLTKKKHMRGHVLLPKLCSDILDIILKLFE